MTGRIDTHQHFIPASYAAHLRERGIRPGGIDLPDWSPERARRFMDRQGIATGILSLSTPGVHLVDDGQARRWAREVNEIAAGLVREDPSRFGFFATLTLPDVTGAISAAEHALDELKADGIVLLANNDGRYLGDPEFSPLLEFLDERAALVFVHPGELPAEPVPGVPSFAADFLLDTTRTVLSLILSGALSRFPRIHFLLAHAGGFIPFISHRVLLAMLNDQGRFKQAMTLLDPDRQVPRHMEVLRRFHYDVALSTAPATLGALLEVAGPSRVTYGSDFPFAPVRAVQLTNRRLERYPLDEQSRLLIDRGNAEELLPRLRRQDSERTSQPAGLPVPSSRDRTEKPGARSS